MSKNFFLYSNFAPIVLFAFDRPEHLKESLNSLSKNIEFNLSKLFIYCDGPRNSGDILNVEKSRVIAHHWPHPDKIVIESKVNLGLAVSVISGVNQIIKTYGKVIVVEDDLVVDKFFLNYLNKALIKYENNPKVMQISGYMFPIHEFHDRSMSLFLPNISSWGWATWDRAWTNFEIYPINWEILLTNKSMRQSFNVAGSYEYSDLLFRQMFGKINSWAIRWNWSVFCHSGVVLYPPVSFVKNIGFDGSGTHCSVSRFETSQLETKPKHIEFSDNIQVIEEDMKYIRMALKKLSGPLIFRIIKSFINYFRRISIKLYYIHLRG